MDAELDCYAAGVAPPAPLLEQLCRYLSECSPQPMAAVEGGTHLVIYVNPAFAALSGNDAEALVGRPFAEAVPEGAANGCAALLDRVFQSGAPEVLPEQEHRQAGARPVYWSYSVWAILGPDDRPAGVMVQVTDSSEIALFRRRVVATNESLVVAGTRQHELTERAEQLGARLRVAVEGRDRFLAVLSHELRNPLAAFSNGLHLLAPLTRNSAPAQARQAMMARQLAQMARLVDDLLDISRITTGKLKLRKERVDLAVIARDAVEASRPLMAELGHELALALPPGPVWLDADAARLGQVFLNLLNNAAKYSERGGRVRLGVERQGAEAVVRVADSGIGIPAEHLPHVFEVFVQVDSEWQRAQGGLGIGLSLVKEFVELHGGRVEAHSGPGAGSEFVVRLPVPARAPAAPGGAPAPPGVPASRRILVVDDNEDSAESLALLLGLMGHEVVTAPDGAAGVALAAEFRPEVVFMDLGMPRMGGHEAARLLRAQVGGRDLFLVALTGWGAEDDRRKTRDSGFDRHMVKPVAPDALAEVVAAAPPPRESRPANPSEAV